MAGDIHLTKIFCVQRVSAISAQTAAAIVFRTIKLTKFCLLTEDMIHEGHENDSNRWNMSCFCYDRFVLRFVRAGS